MFLLDTHWIEENDIVDVRYTPEVTGSLASRARLSVKMADQTTILKEYAEAEEAWKRLQPVLEERDDRRDERRDDMPKKGKGR